MASSLVVCENGRAYVVEGMGGRVIARDARPDAAPVDDVLDLSALEVGEGMGGGSEPLGESLPTGMTWYEAESGCDIEDPAQWHAANPALGKFLFMENFRAAVRAVKQGRSSEYAFRRLRLNNWTTALERWLPFSKWEACGSPAEIPDGAPIWVGVDAAISRDTFAVAWVWVETGVMVEREDGLVVPTSVAHLRVKVFEPVRDGDYIDPADVETFILGLAARHPIEEVAYDPAYMGLLANALQERGVPMEPFPQSPERMTRATETLQRLVLDVRLRHGNDPKLNEQMAGVGTAPTERGVRISKRKSGLKIDAVVAGAMALDRALGEDDGGGEDFAVLV